MSDGKNFYKCDTENFITNILNSKKPFAILDVENKTGGGIAKHFNAKGRECLVKRVKDGVSVYSLDVYDAARSRVDGDDGLPVELGFFRHVTCPQPYNLGSNYDGNYDVEKGTMSERLMTIVAVEEMKLRKNRDGVDAYRYGVYDKQGRDFKYREGFFDAVDDLGDEVVSVNVTYKRIHLEKDSDDPSVSCHGLYSDIKHLRESWSYEQMYQKKSSKNKIVCADQGPYKCSLEVAGLERPLYGRGLTSDEAYKSLSDVLKDNFHISSVDVAMIMEEKGALVEVETSSD